MDESDYSTFERALKRVSGAFRLRMRQQDLDEMTRTYFRVLEAHRLDVVLEAGKRCIETMRTFPKAADWLNAVAPQHNGPQLPADVRYMSAPEASERARAHAMRYRDEPCNCLDCQMAEVTDRELRFVPTLVDGVEERAFNQTRGVVEVAGHWAHGQELARWYVARDAFVALATRAAPAIARRLALVTRDREPGEDG